LERTATGELIVMPPAGSLTGSYNLNIAGQLWLWNRQTRLGKTFDSSAGFKLPDGSIRSPDAAWIRHDRWDALTPVDQEGFAPLAPDFVVALRSASDNLKPLQDKMRDYLANGTEMGWLIDRKGQRVEIYRRAIGAVDPPEQVPAKGETRTAARTAARTWEMTVEMTVEIMERPDRLSGHPLLPGFSLDLGELWV
ncbi:Uma2 family endonuclease, partial [Prochlorothrix hollandica]|uniref:Uma2 family endonuclease n=1 Tax=Prochlorothrix hollandica TaxID=1223 RepID=UPI00333F9829